MENARRDKLGELGAVCYNRYSPEEFNSVFYINCYRGITTAMDKLTIARCQRLSFELVQRYDSDLREKFIELGCFCYSMYVDARFYDPELVECCEYIRLLSSSIAELRARAVNSRFDSDDVPEIFVGDGQRVQNFGYADATYIDGSKAADAPSYSAVPLYGNIEGAAGVGSDLPYDLEPIPNKFKKCNCGYRNRDYAVFCAKCGRQL